MSKKEIIQYLLENNTSLPLVQIILGLLVALLLAVCEYHIYRITYSGVKYSKEFNTTIVMISMITTFVIMIIGRDLTLSLGLVGALSIIRFRTAIKDSKDAAFLFWSVGIGLACGSGLYLIGIVGSFMIGSILVVLYRLRCFDETAYLLIVRGDERDQELVEEILRSFTRRFRLRMASGDCDMQECTYEIAVDKDVKKLLQTIKEKKLNGSVHLVSYQGEISGE